MIDIIPVEKSAVFDEFSFRMDFWDLFPVLIGKRSENLIITQVKNTTILSTKLHLNEIV